MVGQKLAQLGFERTEGTRLDLDERAFLVHGVDPVAGNCDLAEPPAIEAVLDLEILMQAGFHRFDRP